MLRGLRPLGALLGLGGLPTASSTPLLLGWGQEGLGLRTEATCKTQREPVTRLSATALSPLGPVSPPRLSLARTTPMCPWEPSRSSPKLHLGGATFLYYKQAFFPVLMLPKEVGFRPLLSRPCITFPHPRDSAQLFLSPRIPPSLLSWNPKTSALTAMQPVGSSHLAACPFSRGDKMLAPQGLEVVELSLQAVFPSAISHLCKPHNVWASASELR